MTETEVFSQCPPIVENIFKHLPYRDLAVSAQVCKLWHCMSSTERKRRTEIFAFCQLSRCDIHDDHDFIPGRMASSCTENTSGFEDSLQEKLGNVRIKTNSCLAFSSESFVQKFERCFPSLDEPQQKRSKTSLYNRAYLKFVKKSALQRHFPADATVSLVVSAGVIGGGGREFCKPVEMEGGVGLTGICFPDIPGLDVQHFPVTHRGLPDLLPPDLKCLLLFVTPRGISVVDPLVRGFYERGEVALGGAVVETTTDSPLGCCVALSGEGVEASVLVISPTDREEELRKKLKIFGETGLVRRGRRCFAFMFACVARGYSLYRKFDYESTAFHSLYPAVPILGVFANGEIGFNHFPHVHPDTLRSCKLKEPSRRRSCVLSYTTVFVLVSVGGV